MVQGLKNRDQWEESKMKSLLKIYGMPALHFSTGGVAKIDDAFLRYYFSHLPPDGSYVRLNAAFAYLGAHIAFGHIPTIDNEMGFIDFIRHGIPRKALDYLMHASNKSPVDMAALMQISYRTFQKYTPEYVLNPEQSEKALEIARLYSRGAEVFGGLALFKEWMDIPIAALGNKKPAAFLDTSLGIEILMEELGRIEHGIFA